MKKIKIALIAAICLLAGACDSSKKIVYLQNLDPSTQEATRADRGITIQPKDILSIVVTCKDPELAAMFNLPVVSYQTNSEIIERGRGTRQVLGYAVDENGEINFPVLGKLKVAGLSRWELQEKIKKELTSRNLLKDMIVTVEFKNFKISILGEVTAPGSYNIEGDKVTILEALSMAKDLTIYGQRDQVYVIREENGNRTIYLEAALNYARTFGRHSVGAMLLYNQSDEVRTENGQTLIEALPYRFRGLAGRATYSYGMRYFLEFNFGYNGAENFTPKNRYGFFPSVGVGWVVSEESFFEPVKRYIQFLKIRATYGSAGNSNLDGRRFAYMNTIASSSYKPYTFGEDMKQTYDKKYIDEYGVDVVWEESVKANIGLDLNTLNNNLNIQIDFFKDNRRNILLRRQSIPEYAGIIKNPFGNIGEVENKGFDLSVNYNNSWQDWHLSLLGNFSFNRNKIILPLNNRVSAAIAIVSASKGLKVVLDKRIVVCGVPDVTEDVIKLFRQEGELKLPSEEDTSDSPVAYFDQGIVRKLKVFGEVDIRLSQARADMMREYEKKAPSLSAAEREALQREISARFEALSQQQYGPLYQKVNNAVNQVAKNLGISLVLNKQTVMYGGRNITDEVIDTFNASLTAPSESAAPAPAATPAPSTPAKK